MTIPSFSRWMYRGRRPNWLAKIMNNFSAMISSWGVAPNNMVALEVIGRKSGRVLSLPLVMVVIDGERYLVSMLGEDVQWVHNVRAAGGKVVLRSGNREEAQLEEIPVGQRAPIIKAYLPLAPGAQPHIAIKKDAPLAEFEKIAAAYPVFRVVSPTTAQPSQEDR
jgi:deazaflavin-dependent oxidoreductase (nitroreductase family)